MTVEADYSIKQNDFGQTLTVQLKDRDDNPVNVTSAQYVKVLVRAQFKKEVFLSKDCEVGDASIGVVSYTWIESDLNTPGLFEVEWEVKYANGSVQTFPTKGYFFLEVWDDVA